MSRSLPGLVLVGLISITIGVCAEEEVTNAQLLEQFRVMQAAYEGRIAKLEGEVKTLHKQAATMQRAGQIEEGIDRVLDQPGEGKTLAQHLFSGVNPVRSTSQMSMGGYTEFNYIDRGDTTSRFDQSRTVLEFGAKMHENIQFYMELDYEHGAVISGPGSTEGELELEQAWLDFKLFDEAVFRAGMVLVPVGRYNLYHEAWANNFVDRPLVNRRIMPTTWSEEGVGFHGQALDTDFLGISYEAYLFNPGRADRVSPSGGFRNLRLNGDAPIYDSKKAGAFRVAFEPVRNAEWFADYFEIGISGYFSGYDGAHGAFDDDGDDGTPDLLLNHDGGSVQLWALDMTYERGAFGFRGEAVMAHAGPGRTFLGSGQQAFGLYAEAFYEFWPSFLDGTPMGKPTYKDPKLVGAVRFDYVDLALDNFDQRDLRRLTLGLSYRPIERAAFKFDYQMDFSSSGRNGTGLGESGFGDNTDAFLFGVAVGF